MYRDTTLVRSAHEVIQTHMGIYQSAQWELTSSVKNQPLHPDQYYEPGRKGHDETASRAAIVQVVMFRSATVPPRLNSRCEDAEEPGRLRLSVRSGGLQGISQRLGQASAQSKRTQRCRRMLDGRA
jgi:hypothetical protein